MSKPVQTGGSRSPDPAGETLRKPACEGSCSRLLHLLPSRSIPPFHIYQESGRETQLQPTEAKEKDLLRKGGGKVGPWVTLKISPFCPLSQPSGAVFSLGSVLLQQRDQAGESPVRRDLRGCCGGGCDALAWAPHSPPDWGWGDPGRTEWCEVHSTKTKKADSMVTVRCMSAKART